MISAGQEGKVRFKGGIADAVLPFSPLGFNRR
jgi:hypothetical protein